MKMTVRVHFAPPPSWGRLYKTWNSRSSSDPKARGAPTLCGVEVPLGSWCFTFNLTGSRSRLRAVTANICPSQRLAAFFLLISTAVTRGLTSGWWPGAGDRAGCSLWLVEVKLNWEEVKMWRLMFLFWGLVLRFWSLKWSHAARSCTRSWMTSVAKNAVPLPVICVGT